MKNLYFLGFLILNVLSVFSQIPAGVTSGGQQIITREVTSPLNQNIFTAVPPSNGDELLFSFDSLNVTYKGSWAFGQSFSMGCNGAGNIVFVGSGAGVYVLDVSVPSAPLKLSEISTRGLVDAMYFDDFSSRLYLCTYFEGFEIWNLADLQNPHLIGKAAVDGLPRGGIFASGQYVYVVSVANGVYVYDASNPASPVLKANCPVPGTNLVWNSSLVGNYIYLALGNGGMRIVDVSNPLSPSIVGSSAGQTTGLYAEGNLVYVVAYNYGLKILDVSNPSSVTQVGTLALNGWPYRVKKIGTHVYIASSTTNPGGGIKVVDVSSPQTPAEVTTYAGYADWLAGNGNVVAYTGSSFPCNILDISNPASPVLASTFDIPVSTIDVAVRDQYAYSASRGFRVYDISDKTRPVQVGYDSNDGGLLDLAGNTAVYIRESMTANNPVMLMNISDPENPFKEGQYMAPVMTNDIAILDHYAFIACWWDGFRVIDFQNPAAPALVAHKFGWTGSSSIPGVDFCYVQALDIEGNYLYLLDYQPFTNEDTKGLYIFDISDPENPVKLSRYPVLMSSGYDLTAHGNFVYVADQNGGMEIIDVSDVQFPVTRSYITLPDVGWSIDYAEDHVFVACYINGGVQVVNVADPDNPIIDGYYARSGCFALGVRVHGNNIYLSDGPAGFQIYETQTVTRVDDFEATSGSLKITPNPFRNEVRIEISGISQSHAEMMISDFSGRTVATMDLPVNPDKQVNFKWDGRNQSGETVKPGVYLIRVTDGEKVVMGKVVKTE